ncbi:MAG: hypothetical protein IJW72_04800 [Alphaproteobacteria bacterium]|nr:hypothetical protein [Alphaproteobacteria bacterium]
MVNYKYILAAVTAVLLPASVAADVCKELPTCDSLGFTYTATDCGTLKKLKCPFGDAYFCSGNNCKSVSVSSTEKCTKYCAEDTNVCIEKRAMTCSELLSANNCTRYNHNSTISGTISKDICLFGTVKQATGYGSSLTFTQMKAYDAGKRFPVCESEMTGRAKLDLGYISITNYVYFHTDVDIDSVTYSPQGSSRNWSAYFYGNTNITAEWQSSTSWSGTLHLGFFSEYDSATQEYEQTTNKVNIRCVASSSSQWSPSSCDVSIDAMDGAYVEYCGYVDTSSGMCYDGSGYNSGCYGEVNINCYGYSEYDSNSESCKDLNENYGYCDMYY